MYCSMYFGPEALHAIKLSTPGTPPARSNMLDCTGRPGHSPAAIFFIFLFFLDFAFFDFFLRRPAGSFSGYGA